jgi:ABC-type Zn uptake system ZnuABC Zn-binding protein ZnuA
MRVVLLSLLVFIYVSAKPNILVGLSPQKCFIEAIAKDRADITLVSEYKDRDFRDIDAYFSFGTALDKRLIKTLKKINPSIKIADTSINIPRLEMIDQDGSSVVDETIWLSPYNAKLIAYNTFVFLTKLDQENIMDYRVSLEVFLRHINNTDKSIKKILSNTKKGAKFITLSSAWGYIAREYGLDEVLLNYNKSRLSEVELSTLIKIAQRDDIQAIVTPKHFSKKESWKISTALETPVVGIDQFVKDWTKSLLEFAKVVAR